MTQDLSAAAPRLVVETARRVNFASVQNAVPVIRSIAIENGADTPLAGLTLTMRSEPPVAREKSWVIDRVAPGGDVSIPDREVKLDPAFLAGLNEAEHGQLVFELAGADGVLARETVDVELLARDEWGGLGDMAQILAAFVAPNDPVVAGVLKEASRLLEASGHRPAMEGYQASDPARAYMLAAAIWSAVTGMGLTYATPPRSFEIAGQKVRGPGQIAAEGLATCLDTSLLLAAALEAAGLSPVVVFTRGHAFAGVWLVNKTLARVVEPDVTELRKAIAAREFVPFETTLATSRPPAGFDQAVKAAQDQLREERENEFDRAVDITRARSAGIRPLASHAAPATTDQPPAETAPAALPPPPDFGRLPGEVVDERPTTAKGRIERWQRKLLDLSLRNRLLNFADSAQTIPILCPDLPALEDRLADGARLRIVSLADENPVGNRDPELHRQQTGEDINARFASEAFARGQVAVPLPGREMTNRLTTLYRKAKSDLAEGGANTLYLAAGFLRWKKTPTDARVYRAPLLLVPVKLERRSAQSAFTLVHHEDEVRFNATLLQFLERDFGLRIPALAAELPRDASGIDLPAVFETMRAAVRDVPGFEVATDTALSTFSFAKYLMWKDLVDRTDSLRNNRLVRHLIDNPETAFTTGERPIPAPADIDRRLAPADLLTPLPADSSQLAAVVAAADGHDFVIIGPPGTGKSQTIANMIAHCLALGRSVLFVAEKSAALDVVYRRLKAHGLGDAVLELHSNKADRKLVIQQLGAAWDRAAAGSEAQWIKVTDDLRIERDRLNAYVDALHRPGSHGFSVFQAIGQLVDEEAPFEIAYAGIDAHDAASFAALEELAERAARTFAAVEDCRGLELVAHTDWSFAWQGELLAAASALSGAAATLADAAGALSAMLGLASEPDLGADRRDLLARLARVVEDVGPGDYRLALRPEVAALADELPRLERALASYEESRTGLAATYADAEIERMPLAALDQAWRDAAAKIWPLSAMAKSTVAKRLQTYAASGKADPATDISRLRGVKEALAAIAESPFAILPAFAGPATDLAAVRRYLADAARIAEIVSELHAEAEDADSLVAALATLLPQGGDKGRLAAAARAVAAAEAGFRPALDAFARLAGAEPAYPGLASLGRMLTELAAEKARLPDWCKWVAVREEARARGLGPLLEAIASGTVPDAPAAFRSAYFSWWLPLAIDASPELRGFAHWEQASRIERFRKLDEAAQALATAEVRRRVAHGLPARDGVPKKSELGILRHQLGLQRPSVSIRDLLTQMPQSFTKLAPCVLMSPLSVAQYLPADHAAFDIVIFDEASQITTWDAIGAIARGRQSIIVGDPKQLPPTNFFGRSNDEEGEELATYEKDLPSILDESAAAGLPTHQLNWHYRSRDEALIAFSNRHYYGGRLITFPANRTRSEAVRFHKVAGIYARGSGRTNDDEARAIVGFAVARLKDWLKLPEQERPTLGVITFNAPQQERILDLLDAARRDAPELEWFFAEDREEPVIVKNLENIQGDERDVMAFSITFGPDAAGKLPMSFGAVNGDGGEKRLNVAVTRARQELHVFASITADQIDLGRTKALGVAHLKAFLDYAERGPVALPAMDEGSLGPAESPFEEAVAAALRARGWEARTQVGVSGFRIDLGIVHPDKAGAYLAGIECDGATYHASASARDRDRIRESVLRGLGWEILRVWSTDWFKNPAEAAGRIHAALAALLDASRQKDAAEAAALAAAEAAEAARRAADGEDMPEETVGEEARESVAAEAECEADASHDGVAVLASDTGGPVARDLMQSEGEPVSYDLASPEEHPTGPGGPLDTTSPQDGNRFSGTTASDADGQTAESESPLTDDTTPAPASERAPTDLGPESATTPPDQPWPVDETSARGPGLEEAPRQFAREVGATGARTTTAPEPDRFFDFDYIPTLRAVIAEIVDREAPIRDLRLIQAVARAHGWQRAGGRIRERVLACLGNNEVHLEGDVAFVWPAGRRVDVTPFRRGLDRSPRDISRAEIRWLIRQNPDLGWSEDPARDLARLMGIGRLLEDTRAQLQSCLEEADSWR